MKNVIEKYKNELILISFLLLIGCTINLYLGITLKSLPSELYGGDFYYQLGSIHHICRGGNVLESSSIKGGLPGYLPLYGIAVCGFSKLFNLDVLRGMLLFSTIIYFFSFLIWLGLWKILFKDNFVGIIGSLISNPLNMYLILKYTDFSYAIILPLLLTFLFLFIKSKQPNKKSIAICLILSILYGISAISHVVLFVGFTFIILAYLVYLFSKKEFKKFFLLLLGIGLVGIPLSMLYWYKPVFVYKLKMAYDRTHTDVPNVGDIKIGLLFLKESLLGYFFNVSNIYSFFLSLFICAGLFFFFFSNISKKFECMLPLIVGSLFVVYSYFLTEPLFGMNFIPTYQARYFLKVTATFLAIFGIYSISFIKSISKYKKLFFVAIILFLFSFQLLFLFSKINSGKYLIAKKDLPIYYKKLQNYLLENSDVKDVLASTKELSFAINGLTGIKLLTNRWAQQNDPYMNFSQRDLSAAILFYGNNLSIKKEIIRKYNISWFYWDFYWVSSEYTIDENGMVTGWYDPLIIWDSKENRKILEENGIKFIPMNTWVDPWARGEKYKKFKVLLISPENYFNFSHPWNPNLDNLLEEKWNFTYNHQKIARLFKIKI
mgnify:CR=1 FL=1